MTHARHAAAAVLCALAASTASAQTGVTLFGGYAGSEGIENATSGEQARVRSGAAFGVALDFQLETVRDVQLFYGQQRTTLDPGSQVAAFDIDIRYLHLGGTYFFEPGARGAYAVGGLGATYFSPSLNGLTGETRASLNVGFGYLWPIGTAIAVRAEARAFFTLINSSSGFLCSGGCTVLLTGDAFVQGQAMLGLSARF